ncbi:hypothetical protein TNIN_331281 [Trichonephila inaurata madagascariensis]|uniref:Uncharacterized protein n=1 Tax=Trichonephila inaurata madagascariensis TaxID=2747483 RepID=A0A8X7CF43_9ARAC|nr:hypothetical protein TNIN_331281 [Trichonephila inaurata madagascariensis]
MARTSCRDCAAVGVRHPFPSRTTTAIRWRLGALGTISTTKKPYFLKLDLLREKCFPLINGRVFIARGNMAKTSSVGRKRVTYPFPSRQYTAILSLLCACGTMATTKKTPNF